MLIGFAESRRRNDTAGYFPPPNMGRFEPTNIVMSSNVHKTSREKRLSELSSSPGPSFGLCVAANRSSRVSILSADGELNSFPSSLSDGLSALSVAGVDGVYVSCAVTDQSDLMRSSEVGGGFGSRVLSTPSTVEILCSVFSFNNVKSLCSGLVGPNSLASSNAWSTTLWRISVNYCDKKK